MVLPKRRGNALEQHHVGAGRFQLPRLLEQARRGVVLAALHAKAAGLVHRLGLEPEMRAHGDVVAGEELDDLGLLAAAFQLHHLRAALLHQPHGVLSARSLDG